MIIALSLLLLAPLIAYRITKGRHPRHVWAATGVVFGLVIAPASVGLYASYFVSPFGMLPGMLGLVSSFVHDILGFEAISALGLRDPQRVVNTQQWLVMEFINGLCWAIVYGGLGIAIDCSREARARH